MLPGAVYNLTGNLFKSRFFFSKQSGDIATGPGRMECDSIDGCDGLNQLLKLVVRYVNVFIVLSLLFRNKEKVNRMQIKPAVQFIHPFISIKRILSFFSDHSY